MIILATSSPYRQEAFKMLGLKFIAQSSEVNEKFANRPNDPEELVKLLSKLKQNQWQKTTKQE
ncbi:MAG TPA: Maf family protein [Candidatus Nanoarchaeia archaeon]|nr:Maf family protein [Candidatus Nanoarchaeia archaeon]